MNSMISNVSSWWGGGNEIPPKVEPEVDEDASQPTTLTTESEKEPEREKKDEEKLPDEAGTESETDEKDMNIDLDEMSAKAVNTAKEWGTYFFSMGKNATHKVVDTAKSLKDTVEEKTMIGDFTREQEKFVTEKKDKHKHSDAAVAPWIGYNEEEAIKSQIMALSSDKRNFLRNPPSGVQFQFDFSASYPVAMAMLQEDPNLEKMRFELVPKQIKEEAFWRNYFYRVSLIKQSAQMTSMAQRTGTTGEANTSRPGSAKSEDSVRGSATPPEASPGTLEEDREPDDLPLGSPEHEFISDTFQHSQISEDDLKSDLKQLGVDEEQEASKTDKEEIPEWEKELQAELQEYEVVDDDNNLDDTDLEQELMQQLEAESSQQQSS